MKSDQGQDNYSYRYITLLVGISDIVAGKDGQTQTMHLELNMQYRRTSNLELHMAFTDCEKAFDKVKKKKTVFRPNIVKK